MRLLQSTAQLRQPEHGPGAAQASYGQGGRNAVRGGKTELTALAYEGLAAWVTFTK